MLIKTFRVPFAEIVGPEAMELEFGPDDYAVVRPLFSRSVAEVRDLQERMAAVDEDTPPEEADRLVLDMLGMAFMEWHLVGPDGTPIPQPATTDDLDALPAALKGSIFPFLSNYRGRTPNPTTRT